MTKAQMQAELDKLRAANAGLIELLSVIATVVLPDADGRPISTDWQDYASWVQLHRDLAISIKVQSELTVQDINPGIAMRCLRVNANEATAAYTRRREQAADLRRPASKL